MTLFLYWLKMQSAHWASTSRPVCVSSVAEVLWRHNILAGCALDGSHSVEINSFWAFCAVAVIQEMHPRYFPAEKRPGLVVGEFWCWTQIPHVNRQQPVARTCYDPAMLQTMTLYEIMSILHCGPQHRRHKHMGVWYTCRYCHRPMCRVCFLQWSRELKGLGSCFRWADISERYPEGVYMMALQVVDARLCGQCCSKLWHEIGLATLCRRRSWTWSSLPLEKYHFSYMFFRASRNSVEDEIGLLGEDCWPSWEVYSCQYCQHDTAKRKRHMAMCHVGNHERCHLGHHGRGFPCRIVSTTSLLTMTMQRLKETVPWLHVYIVPDNLYQGDDVHDFSSKDALSVHGSSMCLASDPGLSFGSLQAWGLHHKEIDIDRGMLAQLERERRVRQIYLPDARNLFRNIRIVSPQSGDFSAFLQSEHDMRQRMAQWLYSWIDQSMSYMYIWEWLYTLKRRQYYFVQIYCYWSLEWRHFYN